RPGLRLPGGDDPHRIVRQVAIVGVAAPGLVGAGARRGRALLLLDDEDGHALVLDQLPVDGAALHLGPILASLPGGGPELVVLEAAVAGAAGEGEIEQGVIVGVDELALLLGDGAREPGT